MNINTVDITPQARRLVAVFKTIPEYLTPDELIYLGTQLIVLGAQLGGTP